MGFKGRVCRDRAPHEDDPITPLKPHKVETRNLYTNASERWEDPLPYTEKFEDALVYAAKLHRDQTRKGTGVPYVTHLLAVAAIVGESDGTEDEVIAALLHDAT